MVRRIGFNFFSLKKKLIYYRRSKLHYITALTHVKKAIQCLYLPYVRNHDKVVVQTLRRCYIDYFN